MATRGLYGIRKNGEVKLGYNHYDSYMEGLGEKILEFLSNVTLEDLHKIFDKLVLVNDMEKPNKEQIKLLKETLFAKEDISEEVDLAGCWYDILREYQGDFSIYHESDFNVLPNGVQYLESVAFVYLINLDENTFEVYSTYKSEKAKVFGLRSIIKQTMSNTNNEK